MSKGVIISLCDYSGRWPAPWLEAGYTVLLVDIKHQTQVSGNQIAFSGSVAEFSQSDLLQKVAGDVCGVLAAPPCTDFSVSGAQYWKAKDKDGRTQEAINVVNDCLDVVEKVKPCFWALENPVGRISQLVPELGKPSYFQPWEYAGFEDSRVYSEDDFLVKLLERINLKVSHYEAYTKKTGLWGDYNRELPKSPVPPVRYCSQGSWLQLLGGKSERTKELRSNTPTGLAYAFYAANKTRC